MNPFPSTAFKNAARQRTAELVPLLDIVLVDGATAFLSDRRISVGDTTYLPRIVKWGPVSSNITGSSSTATFVLSNVDRIFELAARDHMFQRGSVIFKVHAPSVVTGGGSVSDATRVVWVGWIEKTPYDEKTFTLSCKDGFFDLTLPLPRRRFSRNCDLEFDDGLYCPYSGFGYTGAGSGSRVSVPAISGIFTENLVKDDFDSDISSSEGYRGFSGQEDCDKTFSSCKERGMARFFGGLRYVVGWARGWQGGNKISRLWQNMYTSYSSPNETLYDQAVPLMYCGSSTGFIMNPLVVEWRPDNTFKGVECIVSEGPIGYRPDLTPDDVAVVGLAWITVDSHEPHQGQYPSTPGMGVNRSSGRIGESNVWTELEGDMRNTDSPSDPPLYFSARSGFFARVQDANAGLNDPLLKSDPGSTNSGSSPSVFCQILGGRRCWQYSDLTSRNYGPTGNPAWIILDMALEAFNIKYASVTEHADFIDLQSFIDFGNYCAEEITGLDGGTTARYLFAGQFTDSSPALDHIDSALRDCHGFRFFRNGKLAIRQFSACQDATVRPAFQEFINVVHNSIKPEIPSPKYNELNLSFADRDFDFQKNQATVYSVDYQKLIGLNGRPYKMAQSYNLVGTCLTEQAVRLGLRMLRQELGGTDITQWGQVRNGQLISTFMMSELEAGDITYCAHTLMPNGGDWIRIEEWTLNDDWSLSFKFRSWRSTAYDDILSGDPFVELAKFLANSFVRGSRGIVFPPLPALEWDTSNPLVSIVNVGNRLTWKPYTDITDLRRFQGIQIYRRSEDVLGAGGWLMAEVNGSTTSWKVSSVLADFQTDATNNRNLYQCGKEQIRVTAYTDNSDGTGTLTVTRSVLGTHAESHQRYDQIFHISLLDKLPQPAQVQGQVSANQYIDPWQGTTTTSSTSTTSTT